MPLVERGKYIQIWVHDLLRHLAIYGFNLVGHRNVTFHLIGLRPGQKFTEL